MTNKKYLNYLRTSVLSNFMGIIVWVSLATFMLVAKNEIGVNNIPIFETFVFISGLIATRYIYTIIVSVKTTVLLSIVIETIFLIALYFVLLNIDNIAMAGVVVYMVIIVNAFTGPLQNESKRVYEDSNLKNHLYKRYLRGIRKKSHITSTIGAVIGSSIGLLFLTYFKVDLIEFTKVMLILNIIQNVYDYYLWNKYLK